MAQVHVRTAVEADIPFILAMIKELAAYEKEPDAVFSTEESLRRNLFGTGFGRGPVAEALIGEVDGVPQGVAVFFMNFSTWSGAPGLYLEDLYVRVDARRCGLGRALLSKLAEIASSRGCKRMEWAVLDWNTPAQEFYKTLGAFEMNGWHVWRMVGDSITGLASQRK